MMLNVLFENVKYHPVGHCGQLSVRNCHLLLKGQGLFVFVITCGRTKVKSKQYQN